MVDSQSLPAPGNAFLARGVRRATPYRWLGYGTFAVETLWLGGATPLLLLLPFLLGLFECCRRFPEQITSVPCPGGPLLWLQLIEALLVQLLFLEAALPLVVHLIFAACLLLANLALGGPLLASGVLAVITLFLGLRPPEASPLPEPSWMALILPLVLLWTYACGIAALGYRRVHTLRAAREAARYRLAQLEVHSARQRRYLPLPLRLRLEQSSDATTPVRERRWLVVGFLDLCDFTALTERLDATALERIFEDFLATAQALTVEYGGAVAKVLGDGLLVCWLPDDDTPMERQLRAQDAVACSRDLHRQIQALSRTARERGDLLVLNARIAIACGYCSVGDWGRRDGESAAALLEFTILGAPVNRAARLQQVAEPGGTVLDESVAALVERSERLGSVQLVELKGIGATKCFPLLQSGSTALTLVS